MKVSEINDYLMSQSIQFYIDGSSDINDSSAYSQRVHAITGSLPTWTDVSTKSATSAEVKAEAQKRIYEFFPAWKQANYTARAVELQDTHRANGSWTSAEQTEVNDLQGVWDWIKSVRTASDTIEATPPQYDSLQSDSRWPSDYSGSM